MVAVMWMLEVTDLVLGHTLDGVGILPRTATGLVGIAVAPFLHFGFGHLLANTVPFVVLGLLIAVSGAARVLSVTAITALASGLGVWLLAPSASITAGASGVVFGFAAYLIVRGVLSRHPRQLAITVVVIVAFGSALLAGLMPRAGVSWLGHLFGAAGGVFAARLLTRRHAGGGPRTTASGRFAG